MTDWQRENEMEISRALLTLRHARVRAFELKPGDQIYMRRHDLDEAMLCQNDSGYELVQVMDVHTIHPRGTDETVEVTVSVAGYIAPVGGEKYEVFRCSPLFSGMYLIGKDERV